MALDLQRNWTVSMEKNLEKVTRTRPGAGNANDEVTKMSKLMNEIETITWTTPPVHLPDELIIQILEYVSRFRDSQYTLASCCRLSRQWYSAAIPYLYERPFLYGKNYDPFVRVICPSINLHIRESPLAELVKSLNMANLVHQGSRSWTARLLSRTKNNLEEFIAPQASFAMNCFPALSKCKRLRLLDLSLVSESPPLPQLFRALSKLENLETFHFPRSAGFGAQFNPAELVWPPNLQILCLSGGIDTHFVHGVAGLPKSLRSLTIEHCPLLRHGQLHDLIQNTVARCPALTSMKLAHLPRLHAGALDYVIAYLPQLRELSISMDYVTDAIFDPMVVENSSSSTVFEEQVTRSWKFSQPRLQIIELTNSGSPGLVEDYVSPLDLAVAVDNKLLPLLRQVRVAKSLSWESEAKAQFVEALSDALNECKEKYEAAGGTEGRDLETGVWVVEG